MQGPNIRLYTVASSSAGWHENTNIWRQTFSYDPFGNVSKDSSGYTGGTFLPGYSIATNQFTSLPGITPTYDTDGRLTYDGVNHYSWDVDSKLHTVDTSPSTTVTYDALGRMVEKQVGSAYTQIVYSPLGAARTLRTLHSEQLGQIFTVASAYSALKVGQGMEAAIPISILAIGLARMYRRRTSLLENVIITGIGGASGSVVAGAVFTLPALYILHLDPHPVQTIFICLAGGCLGVLFLIPLRRYFVREMHGQLPFPEATAITEVLVTGEKGGSQAKLLLQATAIAGDLRLLCHHISCVERVSRTSSSCR